MGHVRSDATLPMRMGVGADAGDEPWACGSCAIFAISNFLSNYLNSVLGMPYLNLDAATATTIFRERAGPQVEVRNMSVQHCVELVNSYFEEGKTLPLARGGSITFRLAIRKEGRHELHDAQCGNIVSVQMSPAAWVDHYGNVEGEPARAEDTQRLHCMVLESIDDDGTVNCYNSWQGRKHVRVPSKDFEYVDTYCVLQVSDIEFSPSTFAELAVFAKDRACKHPETRQPRRHPSADAEYGRYKTFCTQQGLDNHSYVVKYTPWAGLPFCLTPVYANACTRKDTQRPHTRMRAHTHVHTHA